MTRLPIYIIVLLLFSSCSQSRYGHLTVRNFHSISENNTKQSPNSESVGLAINTSSALNKSTVGFEKRAAVHFDLLKIDYLSLDGHDVVTRMEQNSIHYAAVEQPINAQQEIAQDSPTSINETAGSLWNFLGTAIVVFLFLSALAWLGTLFGIPFWTGFLALVILWAFIWLLGALGILEFWAGS